GEGWEGGGGEVFAMFWRAISWLASEQICRAARPKDAKTQGAGLVGEHGLGRRRLRYWETHQSEKHSRHHRRDSQRCPRQRKDRTRSRVRFRHRDRVSRRAVGDFTSAAKLGGQICL